MNVDDSYEGAVRRLRRLGHSVEVAPKRSFARPVETDSRMRDLEELATLACDENERLTAELDSAQDEIGRLRRLVTTLQETIAGGHSQDSFMVQPPRRGGGLFAFFLVLLTVGGLASVAMYFYRPSYLYQPVDELETAVTRSAGLREPQPEPPRAVTAAPTVAPAPPKVAPPVAAAKAEPPPAAAVTAPETATRVDRADRTPIHHHHASKHRAAKRRDTEHQHGAATRSGAPIESGGANDPLGGLSL